MPWYARFFTNSFDNRLMEKVDDKPDPGNPAPNNNDDLKKELADLKAKLEALTAKPDPKEDDQDLLAKAKKEKEAKDKQKSDAKSLESAIKFNMEAPAFLKDNEALLPKDAQEIFKQSEKETYDSPIEKDSAIKSALVQSFFSVQANMDLLTGSQKNAVEDWLKLTKNGKQDKAQQIYDSIFEPTFEMLKRVKKAETLRNGESNPSDAEAAYKKKIHDLGRKHYLGEK